MRNRGGRRQPDDIDFSGSDWLGKAKDLINQGNLRRLIVRRPSGRILAEIPLLASIGVIAILILIAPMLMALAALAALVMQFKIEIERDSSVYDNRDDD
ncbi:DUF4342 domain-containing protein [Allochromatium palmeri]|uniref:DUF4342 domain-containing protein n=1 Tax=Allochromatium palmeri TaxID=231048 RepID=A0A6N8EF03_9GAMM|nr:DUF4342 domain-containing protein [Allochromatium palmeri]MTW21117.1 DUF4342 domain-containing protein [Allochromatium palmeri]